MESRIAVDGHDAVDEIVERPARERPLVVDREKAAGVEVAAHAGIAPVDRDRIDEHRLDDLFRRIARMGFVFEGDREFIVGQKCPLVGHAMAERVEHLAAGIDRLVAGEPAKEIVAGVAQGIRHHERAELRLARGDGRGIVVGRLHERFGGHVKRPVGQPKMPGMGGVLEGERPVARLPVGRQVFAGVEDPHAVVLQKLLAPPADVGVDDVVGIVADLEAIARSQQPRKKIFAGVEAVPKPDELDTEGATLVFADTRHDATGSARAADRPWARLRAQAWPGRVAGA